MTPDRVRLRAQVVEAVQAMALESDRFGQAFAVAHGLHPTDWMALLHVMQAERDGQPLTPGALASLLGVSTGSTTAVVDRLEHRGHLRRERDPGDRRRVHLRYAEMAQALAADFFGPLGRQTDAIMGPMQDEDLVMIVRFLADMTTAMALARHGDDDG